MDLFFFVLKEMYADGDGIVSDKNIVRWHEVPPKSGVDSSSESGDRRDSVSGGSDSEDGSLADLKANCRVTQLVEFLRVDDDDESSNSDSESSDDDSDSSSASESASA